MKIMLACPICGLTDWSYNGGDTFTCGCCGAEVATEEMVGDAMDLFASVWWKEADIEEALDGLGIEASEENVKKWRNILECSDSQERITGSMIAAGWDAIYEIINEVNSAKEKEAKLDENDG